MVGIEQVSAEFTFHTCEDRAFTLDKITDETL